VCVSWFVEFLAKLFGLPIAEQIQGGLNRKIAALEMAVKNGASVAVKNCVIQSKERSLVGLE